MKEILQKYAPKEAKNSKNLIVLQKYQIFFVTLHGIKDVLWQKKYYS